MFRVTSQLSRDGRSSGALSAEQACGFLCTPKERREIASPSFHIVDSAGKILSHNDSVGPAQNSTTTPFKRLTSRLDSLHAVGVVGRVGPGVTAALSSFRIATHSFIGIDPEGSRTDRPDVRADVCALKGTGDRD